MQRIGSRFFGGGCARVPRHLSHMRQLIAGPMFNVFPIQLSPGFYCCGRSYFHASIKSVPRSSASFLSGRPLLFCSPKRAFDNKYRLFSPDTSGYDALLTAVGTTFLLDVVCSIKRKRKFSSARSVACQMQFQCKTSGNLGRSSSYS